MSDFLKTVEQLQTQYQTKLPPVDQWNPSLSGDLDMRIDRSGEWYYLGDAIGRFALKKLFASILKREGEEYFLVTPVEKWRIQVEDAPLIVTECEFSSASDNGTETLPVIRLSTNMEDQFIIDENHPLWVEERVGEFGSAQPEPVPYVIVRRNIPALINRSVYYELVNRALDDNEEAILRSAGKSFPLQPKTS